MSPRPDLGPKPRLGYTASLVERASEKRNDETFLRALLADERAGAYAIAGEMVVLKAGDEIRDCGNHAVLALVALARVHPADGQ